MSNNTSVILALHGLVRAVLTQNSMEHGYLIICKSIYPSLVYKTNISKYALGQRELQEICDHIYSFDKEEVSYASCYSACISAQLIAMAHKVPSEIIIGMKKQDKKITGHAWLECEISRQREIINPGNIDITDFHETKRLNPEITIKNWMSQREILDTASATRI